MRDVSKAKGGKWEIWFSYNIHGDKDWIEIIHNFGSSKQEATKENDS